MLKTPYVVRTINCGLPPLRAGYFTGVKRSELGSERVSATSALRPGWPWHTLPVQQKRFTSNKDEKWYDWYERLHADPKASVKDLRKAFHKRAKVEHPDHDKTPGAKARFQNLRDTFENLCDESKRRDHDQQRLARKNAAAVAAARTMDSQPSVADSLRAKWKAEEEARRKTEDMRTRDARKTAQGGRERAKPETKSGSEADSHSSKGVGAEKAKKTTQQDQQRQKKPEETEEDRLRKQKIAEELLAKKQAAAENKKREEDAAAKKARERNRPQERIIVIRGLPPGTELVDLFEPLVDLTPGPVFDAKFWSNRIAAIEFCTDTAARKVLAMAQQRRLFIKGRPITTVEIIRSMNEIPTIGSVSRVVTLRRTKNLVVCVKDEKVDDFLMRHGLQVERTVWRVDRPDDHSIRLASWADAEKARRLLTKHLPDLENIYGPDPCGTRDNFLHRLAGYLLRSSGHADTERTRQSAVERAFVVIVGSGILMAVLKALSYVPSIWK